MKLIPRLAAALKAFDRKVWPAHRVVLTPVMTNLLAQRNIWVADVGVAGGLEERWLGIEDYTRFITFDPKPERMVAQDGKTVCIPMGLWSSKAKKTFYVGSHPDTSSVYPPNDEVMRDFIGKENLVTIRTTEIELDTLDNCLAGRPELKPDFLKVDTEGADLEVLRGAEGALRTSLLGMRIETALMEFRLGAPRLGDFDCYLRERGFMLFHLSRVYLVRNNGLHGYTSRPQISWGDSVYFLTRETLLSRLTGCAAKERESLLVRFVVLLLCHGIHDYAIEVIEAAETVKLVAPAFASSVKAAVAQSADTSVGYFLWSAVGLAFSLAVYLGCWLIPSARLPAKYYFQQRAGRLFHELWLWTCRPHPACVEDPFD